MDLWQEQQAQEKVKMCIRDSRYMKAEEIISSNEDISKIMISGGCRAYLDAFSDYMNPLLGEMCIRDRSGSKADSKPYTNSRPSFRKGVVEEVWENAKGPDGLVRDRCV